MKLRKLMMTLYRPILILVSLQNVYDIYSSAIALLEELEKRETSKKGKPMLHTSAVKIPDQTEKDDDDVSEK